MKPLTSGLRELRRRGRQTIKSRRGLKTLNSVFQTQRINVHMNLQRLWQHKPGMCRFKPHTKVQEKLKLSRSSVPTRLPLTIKSKDWPSLFFLEIINTSKGMEDSRHSVLLTHEHREQQRQYLHGGSHLCPG